MKIFVYEWACGGGFLDRDDSPPESLSSEGSAMLAAVASDFSQLPGVTVELLLDTTHSSLPDDFNRTVVLSAAERDMEFSRLAAAADAAVVIAPEFEGTLLGLAERVVELGGRLLSPGPEMIAAASDKQQTAEFLHAAGVRIPRGRVLIPGERCPAGLQYPAVLKPIDGCGSIGVQLVGEQAVVPNDCAAYRLEEYVRGVPASVAVVCGRDGLVPLPPCRQRLDDTFGYCGGALPLEPGLAVRAGQLAVAALAAMPPTCGCVGVDIVLGEAADGSEDAVIEVNPRHTTSYVGLRAATDANLARWCMGDLLAAPSDVPKFDRSVEWTASGQVATMEP